jgi:hypothetical protein
MKKTFLAVVFAFVLAVSFGSNAYAAFCDENCPVRGFFETTGKTVSKIMPWNWGK